MTGSVVFTVVFICMTNMQVSSSLIRSVSVTEIDLIPSEMRGSTIVTVRSHKCSHSRRDWGFLDSSSVGTEFPVGSALYFRFSLYQMST